MFNIVYATIACIFSSTAFAANEPMTPGIYDKTSGNTLQAYCIEWQNNSNLEHETCTKIQFFETTNNRTTAISEVIDNVTASQMALPGTAPVKSLDTKKIVPFQITGAAWGFDEQGDHHGSGKAMAITTGTMLGAGLLAGAGVATGIPGRPKITESQDLSENLPVESNYAGTPLYDVYVDNVNVHLAEKNNSRWSIFFNEAGSLSPEQRVSQFVQFMGDTGPDDPNLLKFFSAPAGYTLVRIEYSPGYTTKQVFGYDGWWGHTQQGNSLTGSYSNGITLDQGTHLWQHNYNFVFVQDSDIPAYEQYISNKESSNALALKWWQQDMYIYFGSVVGATLLVALAPTIADLFRDLVVYPAHAAHNSRIRKENLRMLERWPLVWNNLLGKNINKTMPVSDYMYTALVKAIKTRHPVH